MPETPDKYTTTLSDGLVIGEADKPFVETWLKDMHGQHVPDAVVTKALNGYFKMQQAQQQKMMASIGAGKVATTEALQREYGPQLKILTAEVDSQGSALPNDLHHKMAQAILPDGTRLGDNVDYIRWRIADALEKNPMATVLPSGQGGAAGENALLEEQAKLKALMGNEKSAYWKGPQAKAMQARALEISEALARRAQRQG